MLDDFDDVNGEELVDEIAAEDGTISIVPEQPDVVGAGEAHRSIRAERA